MLLTWFAKVIDSKMLLGLKPDKVLIRKTAVKLMLAIVFVIEVRYQ